MVSASYRVFIANTPAINAGVRVSGMPKYRNIAQNYARTFRDQKEMQIDVWLVSHAAQFAFHKKYRPANPERFVDPEGFRASVERLEKVCRDQLEPERQAHRTHPGSNHVKPITLRSAQGAVCRRVAVEASAGKS